MKARRTVLVRMAAFVATALLAFLSLPAAPQDQEEHVVDVRALVSREAVSPGTVFKVAVIVKVQPGYHINDASPTDEFMVPTTLTLEGGRDFEVLETFYPAGRRARFEYAEEELAVYDGEVVLGVLLKARAGLPPGPQRIPAVLGYQACDDTSCLPPKELAFGIPVKVAEKSGAELHPEVFSKIRFFRSLDR